MPFKENAIHIPYFPLKPELVNQPGVTGLCITNSPISAPKHACRTGDRVHFPGVCLDPNSCRVSHAQQVIRNFKPPVPARVVGAANVHAGFELALSVVTQKGEHWDDACRGDMQRELVTQNRELLDKFGKALEKVGAI